MADLNATIVRGYGPSQIMAPPPLTLSRVVSAESIRISQTASATVGSGVALIFENGWENRTELGCTSVGILDSSGSSATSWSAFGPADSCTQNPVVAEIVTDEKHDGGRGLHLNYAPSGSAEGPGFVVEQAFASSQNEIWARWWIKYSDNWVWKPATDHKVVILGPDNPYAQTIYFNLRGTGDGLSGIVTIHTQTPADTYFEDTSLTVTRGVWNLMEIHVLTGVNGKVEARLNGTPLTLVSPHSADPLNVNTGAAFDHFKIATVYNDYTYPSGLGLTMQTWIDSFAISAVDWIGGN